MFFSIWGELRYKLERSNVLPYFYSTRKFLSVGTPPAPIPLGSAVWERVGEWISGLQ